MSFEENFILTILGSSAITGTVIKLIEWLVDRFGAGRKKRQQLDQTVESLTKAVGRLSPEIDELRRDNLVIMHDRIYQVLRNAMMQKSLTVSEKANIDYLYERYKKRGGNHNAEVMYAVISSLPIVSDEKED